jgi:tartrate dehydratase alpha subunit/fumarate hydratase class I-like protein
MAREAGCIPVRHPEYDNDVQVFATPDVLKAFEALVRADEREAFAKIQFESILQAIRIEREACAKVCDDRAFQFFSESPFFVEMHGLAEAIRARGNT